MATVRKRKLPSGLVRWQASYVDGAGKRRAKLFERKSDGEAWLTETRHDLVRGLHTPSSVSPTVKEAGALWIKRCREKGLEASTLRGYEEHTDLHIFPFVGSKRLSDLTAPAVNAFADRLRDEGRSPEMVRRVIQSLGAIFRKRGGAGFRPSIRPPDWNCTFQAVRTLAPSYRARLNCRLSLPRPRVAGVR
jgi:integrase